MNIKRILFYSKSMDGNEDLLKRLLLLGREIQTAKKEYESRTGEKFQEDVKAENVNIIVRKDEILQLFFVDKMVRIKGSRIKATDLLNKINECMAPKFQYSKKEISSFCKNKNIEKKKMGGFIYYLDIEFVDSTAVEKYLS